MTACDAPGERVAYVVTHVGRGIVVGRAVCTVAARRHEVVVEGAVNYEQAWHYGSQLAELPADLADAVLAWLERGE